MGHWIFVKIFWKHPLWKVCSEATIERRHDSSVWFFVVSWKACALILDQIYLLYYRTRALSLQWLLLLLHLPFSVHLLSSRAFVDWRDKTSQWTKPLPLHHSFDSKNARAKSPDLYQDFYLHYFCVLLFLWNCVNFIFWFHFILL